MNRFIDSSHKTNKSQIIQSKHSKPIVKIIIFSAMLSSSKMALSCLPSARMDKSTSTKNSHKNTTTRIPSKCIPTITLDSHPQSLASTSSKNGATGRLSSSHSQPSSHSASSTSKGSSSSSIALRS